MSGATSVVSIIGAVISAASSAYGGYVANDNAIDNAKKMEEQAVVEVQNANKEADAIREKGQRIIATQEAAGAGSGIKLDGQGGTVDAITGETKKLAEQDAFSAIVAGQQRAGTLLDQAKQSRQAGQGQLIAGMLGATSQVASAVGKSQVSDSSKKMAATYNLGTNTLEDKYFKTGPKLTLLSGGGN